MDGALIREFSDAIRGADHEVDLFGGAMVIARLGNSAADPHRVAAALDDIAEGVREQAGDGAEADALAHAVDHRLFTVLGFRGNEGDYADPRNSYLDQVVERRLGIPITLSLVYMEVAQRVGLICDGIGYPGHFMVRCGVPEGPVYVDPFNQGARVDREELLAGLRGRDLGGAHPDSLLKAVTRRQILQRMLNNLHAIFREQRDVPRWLEVVELQLALEPWNSGLVGERGMLYYRSGEPERALSDLERYVAANEREAAPAGALRLLDELRLRYGDREGTR